MAKIKKAILIFISLIINLVAGGVIYYFWQPVASWYFNYRPILGIDFYNLASYVTYLARHFVWQFNGWKYTWWGGGPLSVDYPTFHAYLVLPLLHWFDLIQSIQIYVLASCFLFLFFAYLLFVEIGKDRVLAVVLTLASSFSIGLYGALVMGGSLPYFATQFFLPLVFWCLVKYFNTENKRWFYLSSLFLGISFLAHPQVGFSYIIPIAFLLLLVYPIKGEKFLSYVKLGRIFIYFLIGFLIGYPELDLYLGRTPLEILTVLPRRFSYIINRLVAFKKDPLPTAGGDPSITAQAAPELVAFSRGQLKRLITDTNQTLFIFLAAAGVIFILSLLLRKRRRNSLKTFVFALPALWVVFYISLFAFGISIFHGGWHRVFWPFPLVLGILISFIWGDFWVSVKERLGKWGQKFVFSFLISVVSGIMVFFPGLILLSQNSAPKMLARNDNPGYRIPSSALPDSLGVYIKEDEVERLKEKLVPSWLEPDNTQYRLFCPDQRVNIWWNTLYEMPLVKGYIELPPGDAFTGAFYWASIALTSGGGGVNALTESWGYPERIAYNNALFLIDWFSVKYIETGHPGSSSYNPLATYLAESSIFENEEEVVIPGLVQIYTLPSPNHPLIWHPEGEKFLNYYGIKNELVSPITHSTNASVVGVIGLPRAYQTVIRGLATLNLNSKRVIPVRLGQFIDGVSYEDLKDMEAIILYAYDYKNHDKAWEQLEKYVDEGGRVWIETGSEVKQTDSVNLPARFPQTLPRIFPIEKTKQAEIGTEWQLSGKNSKETKGVDLKAFGPPVIDDQPWLFSLPKSDQDLRQGVRTILSANGIPLIVAWQYGRGEVIWSGMNLPYHLVTYKNLDEAKLFKNLLSSLVDLSPVSYSGVEVKRESPNKVTVKGSNAKGVFFRENSNPGWMAKLVSGGKTQSLPIYKSGPTFYGFSYVRLPEKARDSFVVTFSYRGEFWTYFWQVLSFLTIFLVIDRAILGSRLLVPVLRKVLTPLKKKVGGWWEKEEES
jgi:hypothetical protein